MNGFAASIFIGALVPRPDDLIAVGQVTPPADGLDGAGVGVTTEVVAHTGDKIRCLPGAVAEDERSSLVVGTDIDRAENARASGTGSEAPGVSRSSRARKYRQGEEYERHDDAAN